MGILNSILLVFFIIICVLLILMVAIQDEKQSGLAGIFGGRGGSTFGAETASVVVKITATLTAVFFALALLLSILNKSGRKEDSLTKRFNEETAAEQTVETADAGETAAVEEVQE